MRENTFPKYLCCPACLKNFSRVGYSLVCQNKKCMRVYPILESGIPLLIDETKSIFRFNDFIGDKITFFPKRKRWLDISFLIQVY
jgi:uncharacterized protein YbaR (Trm112 family)